MANYASRVYGDNIEMNLKFIKAKMDSVYGYTFLFLNFFVYIQTDPVLYSISVYMRDNAQASLEGIN